MSYNRRNANAVTGYVNFPNHVVSTNEGGMYVQLIVVPIANDKTQFMQCSGSGTNIHYSETLVHADSQEWAELDAQYEEIGSREYTDEQYKNGDFIRDMDIQQEIVRKQTSLFFPYIRMDVAPPGLRYLSFDLLAAVNLGSTGWSGDFRCTYDDLNYSGKTIYKSLETLYAGTGKLVLLTWLDT